MRVPLSQVGRTGALNLTFALQGGQTVLREAYCEVPFKITRVFNSRQPVAELILMHCTAGLFGGDDLSCSIRVERGARVKITQQSATKVHPSQDRAAIQHTQVSVETGGELQLYLEPIIPFADSNLRQSARIDVESGGRLVYWESFMAGRIGRGESWRFRNLTSETEVAIDGKTVFLDRFQLLADCRPSIWGMAGNHYAGTGLFVGEQARCFATRLHEALPEAGVDALCDEVAVLRTVAAKGPIFHRCREIFRECSVALSRPIAPVVEAVEADGGEGFTSVWKQLEPPELPPGDFVPRLPGPSHLP